MAKTGTARLPKIKGALINVNKQVQRLALSDPDFSTKAESLTSRLAAIQGQLKMLANEKRDE